MVLERMHRLLRDPEIRMRTLMGILFRTSDVHDVGRCRAQNRWKGFPLRGSSPRLLLG